MKEKKKEKLMMGILLFLVVLLVIAVGCLFYKDQNSGVKLDDQATAYEGKVIRPDDWDENQIAIPGYETIQMEQNTDVLPIVLVNPKGNPCYFKFTLYIDEDNEALYSSDFVEPGNMVQNIKLNKAMDAGTHKLTIDIETISLHDGETRMNGSQVITEIITYEK